MGLRFRKSVKMGPFRMTFSKSGVSTSVGTKGYRVTKRADGKVQTTASIPGTGISHVTVHEGTKKTPTAPQRKKDKFTGSYFFQGAVTLVSVLAIIFLLIGLSGCSSSDEPPQESQQETQIGVTDVEEPEPAQLPEEESQPESAADSEPEPEPEPAPEPSADPEPEPEPAPAPEPSADSKPEPEPAAPAQQEPESAAPVQQETPAASTNSMVYHELSCGSVSKMSEKNKVPMESAAVAEANGYEPCQNCH